MSAHAVSGALRVTCLALGAALIGIYFSARPHATDDRPRPVQRLSAVRAAGAAELTIMRDHRLRTLACQESDAVACRDEARARVPAESASVRQRTDFPADGPDNLRADNSSPSRNPQ